MEEPISPNPEVLPPAPEDVPMEDEVTRPSILDELPARPPTPPKDKSKILPDGDSKVPSSSPPEGAPTSSAENAEDQRQRRVKFSPYTDYHQPWKYDDTTNIKQPLVRSLALSAEAGTPSKPILKPFDPPLISVEEIQDPYAKAAFGELLESVCDALTSWERTKKSDTYESFANTLRAYDALPDRKMLAGKMSLITRCIRRDFNATIPDVGTADVTLIKQANKVLTVFAWSPELVELIPEDDVNYFINRAIETLDQGTSKALSTMSLFFLNQQKFSSKYMTTEKATKIIEVVDQITKKQQGTTVNTERVSLYGRLLVQAKSSMIQNASLWVDHVLQALLCSVNETRRRALAVATELANQIGHEAKVSRAVNKLFPSTRDDPKKSKKTKFIQDRLEEMLQSKDDAIFVPQTWGVIITLLRGLAMPIDRWENFNPLLSIMSKCFNSSEQNLKVHAHLAWAKLIYASNINGSMSRKHLELLLRPIVGFIDEKKASRHVRPAKKAAIHNICTIMYYAFKPGASVAQIEFFWETLVLKHVGQYLLTSKNQVRMGCDILNGLFVGSAKWVDNRALQGTPIGPEELPRIDPKWIRAKVPIVFEALRPAFWTCLKFQDPSQIPHLAVFKKLMTNVAESAKKEIRVSAEMMEFVASLLNFLKQLLAEGMANPLWVNRDVSLILTHLMILVQLAINELGTTCFTEKWLADDGSNTFTAVSTPAGKSASTGASNNVVHHPPVWHLFKLFIDPFVDAFVLPSYARPISNVIDKFVDAQDSRRKKISLLMQGLTILPTNDVRQIHRIGWIILANSCQRILPINERNPKVPPNLTGAEIRDVLTLLEWGYTHRGHGLDLNVWRGLYDALFNTVLKEHGVGFLAPAIIDPVAEFIRLPELTEQSDNAVDYIVLVGRSVQHPKVTVQHEVIWNSLFGDHGRKHIQQPYKSLFSLFGQTLRKTSEFAREEIYGSRRDYIYYFVDMLQKFISDTPQDAVPLLVDSLQDGLALWLRTNGGISDSETAYKIYAVLSEIWKAIIRTKRFDSDALKSYNTVIAAALECRTSKHMLRTAVGFWNSTFGDQEALEYPPRVRQALQDLRGDADLLLPTFPDSVDGNEDRVNPPPLLETQISDFGQHHLSSPPRYNSSSIVSGAAGSTSGERSSKPVPPKQSKLRHMDSQIEYQPIFNDENDDPEAMESQLMTDHQKEVRDRQARDVDLFRDLNSTSPSKRAGVPEKLDLRLPHPISDSASESGQPSSPVDDAMEGFQPSPNPFTALMDRPVNFPPSDDILSSPTTRFAKNKFVQELEDIPSSPPLQPVDLTTKVNLNGATIELDAGTMDPRNVELSQGSKLRIEEGELPPHLEDLVKSIPRSPQEAVELQNHEQVEQEKVELEVVITAKPKEPSQLEDISIHLNSQPISQELSTSSENNVAVFSTAPEVSKDGDDESVYSNVPDSPSSKISGAPSDLVEGDDNNQAKVQKRKRGRGRPRASQKDKDEEMLDCIVLSSQEPIETASNLQANIEEEDDESEHPPNKKTKPVKPSPKAGSLRVQPARGRRSLVNRSVSNSVVQEVQESTKKENKPPTTGTFAQTRRSRVAAALFVDMTVPDSQSPRKLRSRRDSTTSVASVQESKNVTIFKDISRENEKSKELEEVIPATVSPKTSVQPFPSVASKLEVLFEEMKSMESTELTNEDLKEIDSVAFDIMHWVRDQQQNRRSGGI